MKRYIAKILNNLLRPLGLSISKILPKSQEGQIPRRFTLMRSNNRLNLFFDYGKSQYGQDWFVDCLLKKDKGFFVEFGGVDGIVNSNTYFFEKALNWNGIIAEPARKWHSKLYKNRSCNIETDCLYSTTGKKMKFIETGSWKGGNTLEKYIDYDGKDRKASASYYVNSISLNDMLRKYDAPRFIDFMSIDTEGSEFEILSTFNFSSYEFGLVCVEHNSTLQKREQINELFINNNYIKIPISELISPNDDWYASKDIFNKFKSAFID